MNNLIVLPKTRESTSISLFQIRAKSMEKYQLTGTDLRSATILVMDTGHFSYSGLRGVHAVVDCVPKWLT